MHEAAACAGTLAEWRGGSGGSVSGMQWAEQRIAGALDCFVCASAHVAASGVAGVCCFGGAQASATLAEAHRTSRL